MSLYYFSYYILKVNMSSFRICPSCQHDRLLYGHVCNCHASSPIVGSPLKRSISGPRVAFTPAAVFTPPIKVSIAVSKLDAAMKAARAAEYNRFSAKIDCDLAERRLDELHRKNQRWVKEQSQDWVRHYSKKIAECEEQLGDRRKKLMESTLALEQAKAAIEEAPVAQEEAPKRRRLFH